MPPHPYPLWEDRPLLEGGRPKKVPLGTRTDRCEDLLGLGVALRTLLREDEVPVYLHLEDPATRRDYLQVGYLMLEFGQQLVRQTDGSRCVASLSAVLDGYLHDPSLRGRLRFSRACRTLVSGYQEKQEVSMGIWI